jgi:tetratricopeptide (TPR) repeat protein
MLAAVPSHNGSAMDLVSALQRFLSEIRRRRMFRAAAVYLAVAFVILQLGDLVVEPLALPAWTMTLLIVITAVGFILTLVLAWAFDLTPDGVQRTMPAAAEREGTQRSLSPGRRRTLLAAALAVVVLGGGWLARSAFAPAPAVADSSAIAVLPFRVSGAGGDLEYMREGIVDLLAAILTERAGLSTVSPRLLLRELGDDDYPAGDARTSEIVRRLGGGRIVTGEVVGRSEQLTITATLHDLFGGAPIPVSVNGPERDLERLLDRLAAQLVARQAEGWRDAGSLDDVPLAALRQYLEGLSLQRRGQWNEATARFRRALEIDSTFAAAGLRFDIAGSWGTATWDERSSALATAWSHRHRLGPLDRLQLEGILGPNYPDISAPVVRLRIVEDGLAAMPDRPELWYLFGDILFHEGQAIGVSDWQERAVRAFERARAMAPDHPESDYHLMQLSLEHGDTVLFRELAATLMARDTAGEMRPFVRGLGALHEDTPTAWSDYRNDPAGGDLLLFDVAMQALAMGRGLEHLAEIAREREDRAVTIAEAAAPWSVQIQLLGNMGRPRATAEVNERALRRRGPAWRAEYLQLNAWIGFAWDGDTIVGRAALEELRQILTDQARNADAEAAHPWLICTVGVIDLLHGRADWAADALPWLERGAVEIEEPAMRMQAQSCPVILRAGIAHLRGPPAEAQRRLRELETYLTENPFGAKRLRAAGNLLALSLHETAGDLEAALAAARRLQDRSTPGLLSTAIREEGRLLERLGRTQEAAALYRRYLSMRVNAEPSVQPIDDAIRTRLSLLEQGPR